MDGVGKQIESFYKGKRVFITGHTGFKGSWLCLLLCHLGAEVAGYALPSEGEENLFQIASVAKDMESVHGDIRDLDKLSAHLSDFKPQIVIHMAAQPLVRESYQNPVYTYDVNVMGTVHLLEAVCRCDSVRSVVNVTTDKVYQNNEWPWGYRETDILDGFDPYSNSKSCSELVTSSYKKSFLTEQGVAVSTCRAGNVIGGGDFAKDRIVPDCIRAVYQKQVIKVRNPFSVRPYQHVLEPLLAYLLVAWRQYENITLADSYNVGPNDDNCMTTGQLVDEFCNLWGDEASWHTQQRDRDPHEAGLLKLDCSKLKAIFGWSPAWDIKTSLYHTVEWYKGYLSQEDMGNYMFQQIKTYLSECRIQGE